MPYNFQKSALCQLESHHHMLFEMIYGQLEFASYILLRFGKLLCELATWQAGAELQS
jgi:hypothetical protein